MIDFNSASMQAIRNARTAPEINRALSAIAGVIRACDKTAPIESLSATKITMSDLEGATPVTRDVNLASTFDLSSIDMNAVHKSAKEGKQLAQLNQALAELSVAYQIINSGLLTSLKSRKQASESLLKLMDEAKAIQVRVLNSMKVQSKSVPKEHKDAAASISKYLKKIIPKERYSSIAVQTFISGHDKFATNGENNMLYQTFVFIKDFVNTDGVHYAKYSAVFTSTVDTITGAMRHYLTTLVDEQAPGSFGKGSEVAKMSRLQQALNNLLAVDGFLSYEDRRPVPSTTEDVRKTALGAKRIKIGSSDMEISDGLRVQNDKLYVRLVEGMSAKEREVARSEIIGMATQVFTAGKKNVIVTSKLLTGRKSRDWIELIIVSKNSAASKGVLTAEKIRRVGDLLQLSPKQIVFLKQAAKGDF